MGRLLNDLRDNWPAYLNCQWPGGKKGKSGHSAPIIRCQIVRDTFNGDVESADVFVLNGWYTNYTDSLNIYSAVRDTTTIKIDGIDYLAEAIETEHDHLTEFVRVRPR